MTSTLETLRALETTALDAAEGYTTAARSCDDAHTREILAQFAIERREQAEELRLLTDHPSDEHLTRSRLARLHRAVIEVRGRISHAPAVIRECIRGEEVALAQYERALARPLVRSLHDRLTAHAAAVRHALSVLRADA